MLEGFVSSGHPSKTALSPAYLGDKVRALKILDLDSCWYNIILGDDPRPTRMSPVRNPLLVKKYNLVLDRLVLLERHYCCEHYLTISYPALHLLGPCGTKPLIPLYRSRLRGT